MNRRLARLSQVLRAIAAACVILSFAPSSAALAVDEPTNPEIANALNEYFVANCSTLGLALGSMSEQGTAPNPAMLLGSTAVATGDSCTARAIGGVSFSLRYSYYDKYSCEAHGPESFSCAGYAEFTCFGSDSVVDALICAPAMTPHPVGVTMLYLGDHWVVIDMRRANALVTWDRETLAAGRTQSPAAVSPEERQSRIEAGLFVLGLLAAEQVDGRYGTQDQRALRNFINDFQEPLYGEFEGVVPGVRYSNGLFGLLDVAFDNIGDPSDFAFDAITFAVGELHVAEWVADTFAGQPSATDIRVIKGLAAIAGLGIEINGEMDMDARRAAAALVQRNYVLPSLVRNYTGNMHPFNTRGLMRDGMLYLPAMDELPASLQVTEAELTAQRTSYPDYVAASLLLGGVDRLSEYEAILARRNATAIPALLARIAAVPVAP